MFTVYKDTSFYIAYVNPHDEQHQVAVDAISNLYGTHGDSLRFVTSDAVLIELLEFLRDFGGAIRSAAIGAVSEILKEGHTDLVSSGDQGRRPLHEALDVFSEAGEYSFTEAISFVVCQRKSVDAVLSANGHFKDRGFEILL